jgi:hypothetical protein
MYTRIALFVAFTTGAAGRAHACMCTGPRDAASASRVAAAVFAGRANRERPRIGPFGPERVIAFALERSWNGGPSRTLDVRTAAYGSVCGDPFAGALTARR